MKCPHGFRGQYCERCGGNTTRTGKVVVVHYSKHHCPHGVLFFEPQTGIYKPEDWPSNFYHFRLDARRSWSTMTADWLEANIAKATVGSGGLEYEREFLEELAKFEESTSRLDAPAKRLGINAPQKLGGF